MHLTFEDSGATVAVPEHPGFLAALGAAASGWSFAVSSGAKEPVASVSERDGGLLLSVSGGGAPVKRTAVSAACGLMVEVVKAYVSERPDNLCLHCGAVMLGGRLVVFPSRFRAGKSTLIAGLAAAGHSVFSDDVLPISRDDLKGIALGMAPRLRIPLPEGASQFFREFVADHTAAADRRYAYLDLPAGRLAAHNAIAPIGAIVLLDRIATGPASLHVASPSFTLRSLISQNFARSAPSPELLRRMHTLTETLPRFVLRYSEFEEATTLVETTFASSASHDANGMVPKRDAPIEMSLAAASPHREDLHPSSTVTPHLPMVRNADVVLQRVGTDLFLADAAGQSIYCLNGMGAGLWNLLAQPTSQAQAVEVLIGAFPQMDRAAVAADVARVFAGLAESGLILDSRGSQAAR